MACRNIGRPGKEGQVAGAVTLSVQTLSIFLAGSAQSWLCVQSGEVKDFGACHAMNGRDCVRLPR